MKKPAIAIIQARTSSNRLPGKVLKPLAGMPMIWHIYQRAASCRLVDKVVVATSKEKTDDALADFCEKNEMNVFRGDLDNVLSRFLDILEKNHYAYLVRVTGDCPLIWPAFIDEQLTALAKFDGDVTWMKESHPCLEGQGTHSARSLFYIGKKTASKENLEHVGSRYFAEHPNEFRIVELIVPIAGIIKKYRLTVDEEKDYQLIKTLYENLYDGKPIDFLKAIKWLDHHQDVALLNEEVVHKKLNIELEEKRNQWVREPKAGVHEWKP
ncbi:MAG: NTP transferase domain-containing protein [Candidatus Omnitrophota bacterium]